MSLRPLFLNAYQMYINDGVVTKKFQEIEDTILDCVKTSSDVLPKEFP